MGIDVIFRCIFARIVVGNFMVVFKMLSYGHVNIVLSHKASLWVLLLMLLVHQPQWHVAVSMVLLRT